MAELNTLTTLLADGNLKAYYRLANTSDSGSGGFTLTNNNSVPFVSAKYSNGADFGSSNTNKSLTINNNLGITAGNVSISCWVKLKAEIGSGTWGLVGQEGRQIGGDEWIRYQIGYEYNGGARRLRFSRVKNDVADQTANYTITLGTSSWHHLVLTYDGTNLRGYVDGTLQAGPTAASGFGGSANGHSEFSIGASPSGTNTAGEVENYASAIIDDVAVFNRVLNSTEVTSLYTDPQLTSPAFILMLM